MHKTIAATIGLMLYWPMLRGPYFQNLLFTPCPTGLDGREAYAIANILIVGLAALALRRASQFPHYAIRSACPSFSLLTGFACAIAAALLLSSSQLTSTFAPAMQLAGIVSFAIGFSAITLGWFSHLLTSHENWSFIASVSFAASFASASIEYLPDSAVKASLAMLPLASSALLALANCVAKQPEKERAAIPHQQSFPHANNNRSYGNVLLPHREHAASLPVRTNCWVYAHVGNSENIPFLISHCHRDGGDYEAA